MTFAELLRYAITRLDQLQVPYALVGSVASGIWGEPRMTLDIDIVVHLEKEKTEDFQAAFPDDQFYLSPQALREAVALRRPFNVIHPTSGIKIDFMIDGEQAWQQHQLQRRKQIELMPELVGSVAAPEDVILGKLYYYREGGSEKHLRDIAGILKVSAAEIDRQYLQEQIATNGLTDAWQAVLAHDKPR